MEYDVKDMLEIAIANNDSLWEVAVIDRLHGELERLYSQEAKAKAFDVIKEYITDELRDMRRVTEDVPFAFAEELEALEDVLDKMTEYESGEPNAKK